MKAEEAKNITDNCENGVVVGELLKIIYDRIKTSASRGFYDLKNPFWELPVHALKVQLAVMKILERDGFEVYYNCYDGLLSHVVIKWDKVKSI